MPRRDKVDYADIILKAFPWKVILRVRRWSGIKIDAGCEIAKGAKENAGEDP